MNPLDPRITRLLQDLKAGSTFHAIHAGESVPPLTDYHVQRLPDECDAPIPPEFVGGRNLIPLFCGCDSYAFYCADDDSHEILEIDPEEPWPPHASFATWREFAGDLYHRMGEDKTDAERSELRRLLDIDF